MSKPVLERLQDWYLAQCDEDWEHSYGVKIDTLDNPGWLIDVDLKDTSLEFRPFDDPNPENQARDYVKFGPWRAS